MKKSFFNLITINILLMIIVFFLDAYFFASDKISLYGALILFLIFAVCPISVNVPQFYFLLPFQNYLVFNGNVSLLILLQIVLVFKLLITNAKFKKVDFFFILFLSLLQVLTFFSSNSDIISILSFVIMLISVSLIKNNTFFKSEIKDYSSIAFVIGLVISVILPLIVMNTQFARFSGLWTNPNIFGLQLLIGLSLLLYIDNKMLPIFVKIIFGGVFLYSITLTMSRSSIFGLAIVIFLFIFDYFNSKIKIGIKVLTTKNFFFFLTLTICLLVVFNIVVFPIIEERGILSQGDDFSAGRITHLINNVTLFFNFGRPIDWIIGTGIENSVTYLSSFSSNLSGTHNTFVEMFLSSGFLGVIIWSVIVISFISKRDNDSYILPILGVITFYTFTAHLNASLFIYYLLLFSSLPSRQNQHCEAKNQGIHP